MNNGGAMNTVAMVLSYVTETSLKRTSNSKELYRAARYSLLKLLSSPGAVKH